MHWLPPHPTPLCPCDSISPGTRKHYTTQCSLMEPIIIQLQMTIHHHRLPPVPSSPPGINIIDHLLNLLPSDLKIMRQPSSHWQRTWSLILSALLTIDINSHSTATFEPEESNTDWIQPSPPPSIADSSSSSDDDHP